MTFEEELLLDLKTKLKACVKIHREIYDTMKREFQGIGESDEIAENMLEIANHSENLLERVDNYTLDEIEAAAIAANLLLGNARFCAQEFGIELSC